MKIQVRSAKKGEVIIMGFALLVVGGLISRGVSSLCAQHNPHETFVTKGKRGA
jgi:hypothetical protein